MTYLILNRIAICSVHGIVQRYAERHQALDRCPHWEWTYARSTGQRCDRRLEHFMKVERQP